MSATQDDEKFSSDVSLIGARVKRIRKSKLLTITDLALYTGLSVGYLSNVERNQTSPTVVSLSKICRALGVTLEDVLRDEVEERTLVRRGHWKHWDYPACRMEVEQADFSDERDTYELIAIDAGDAEATTSMHPYDEVCFMMEGTLTVTLDGEPVDLHPGDALRVKANIPHTLENRGTARCVSYWHHRNA